MAAAQTYQSEFTGEQMDARFTAVATLIAALEELTTVVAGKYVKPADGIPSTDMTAAVQASLAKAESAVQSLADYYTKTEVDQLLAAINGMDYVDVSTLPTASASTMGKIYLVGPDASGYYAYYYTSYDGTDYSWVGPLGTTEISLSNYATKAELNQLDQKVGETEIIPGEESIDIGTLVDGSIRHATGAGASSTTNKRSDFINVESLAGKTLIYSRQKTTASSPNQGLAFYTSNDASTYISGEAWVGSAAQDELERREITVPATAKYVRFCVIGTFAASAYMKKTTETVVYTSGLGKDVQDLQSEVDKINENIYKDVAEPQAVTEGKVYTLTVGSAPSLGDSASYKCIAVTGLQVGDKVSFHGYSGSSYATWGKAKSGIVTYASSKGVEVNTTVECDGTFDSIYVNAYNSRLNPPTASIIKPANAFDYVDAALEEIEEGLPTRKSLNILCFGNSFTQGSMGYVPAILKRLAPDVDVTIDMAVIGASPLAQHLAYFTDTEQSSGEFKYYIDSVTGDYIREAIVSGSITDIGGYTLLESVNGGKWSSASNDAKIPAILARKDWNMVTFQQRGASDGLDYDTYFAPFIYKLQKALALQMGHNVQLAWIMTHGAYKTTTAQRLADWEDLAGNAETVMQKTGTALLLPYGTAVQNLRTTSLESLGDYDHGGGLLVDEGHLQQGIGCLAASYAIALAILKEIGYGNIGIIGDDLRPDAAWLASIGVNWNIGTGVIGISDENCALAQMAATAAVNRPYDLTDISVYEDTQV